MGGSELASTVGTLDSKIGSTFGKSNGLAVGALSDVLGATLGTRLGTSDSKGRRKTESNSAPMTSPTRGVPKIIKFDP